MNWDKLTLQCGLCLMAHVSMAASLWVLLGADHVDLAARASVGVGLWAVAVSFAAACAGVE